MSIARNKEDLIILVPMFKESK